MLYKSAAVLIPEVVASKFVSQLSQSPPWQTNPQNNTVVILREPLHLNCNPPEPECPRCPKPFAVGHPRPHHRLGYRAKLITLPQLLKHFPVKRITSASLSSPQRLIPPKCLTHRRGRGWHLSLLTHHIPYQASLHQTGIHNYGTSPWYARSPVWLTGKFSATLCIVHIYIYWNFLWFLYVFACVTPGHNKNRTKSPFMCLVMPNKRN